jgi:hypothetical protein
MQRGRDIFTSPRAPQNLKSCAKGRLRSLHPKLLYTVSASPNKNHFKADATVSDNFSPVDRVTSCQGMVLYIVKHGSLNSRIGGTTTSMPGIDLLLYLSFTPSQTCSPVNVGDILAILQRFREHRMQLPETGGPERPVQHKHSAPPLGCRMHMVKLILPKPFCACFRV